MSFLKKAIKPLVNNVKGNFGEQKVKSALNPWLFGKTYHRLINNYIILDKNNHSHQIDHIEIRENGIFCIETKNLIGTIYGDKDDLNWVQVVGRGEKNYHRNPIKQNESHIYQLNKVLKYKYQINPLIVMVKDNANTIKIPYVINLSDLKDYLSNFKNNVKLSHEEIDHIYNILISKKADISNSEHVKNIQENLKRIEKEKVCPLCGNKLVLRHSPTGDFYGCSNFPYCTYSLKKK